MRARPLIKKGGLKLTHLRGKRGRGEAKAVGGIGILSQLLLSLPNRLVSSPQKHMNSSN